MDTTPKPTDLFHFSITQERTLSRDELADIMVAALEGGSNYWYTMDTAQSDKGGAEYWSQAPVYGHVTLAYADDPDEYGWRRVDLDAVLQAMRELAQRRPATYGRLIENDYDADDADALLQLAAFGDILFG